MKIKTPNTSKSYALYYKRPDLETEYFTGYFEESEESVFNRARALKQRGFEVRVVEQVITTHTIRAFL